MIGERGIDNLEHDKTEWLFEWLMKQDFDKDIREMEKARKERTENPNWDRPVVMYGVRRMGHKCIKKQEIAVVIDCIPWQKRARTAETHWYKILFKRLATDIEMEEVKGNTRRYRIFSYYVEKGWSVDKIVSSIVEDDREGYGIDPIVVHEIIRSFENFYKRPIRIYKLDRSVQLKIEFEYG